MGSFQHLLYHINYMVEMQQTITARGEMQTYNIVYVILTNKSFARTILTSRCCLLVTFYNTSDVRQVKAI